MDRKHAGDTEGRAQMPRHRDRVVCQGTRGGGPQKGGCQDREEQRGAARRVAERGAEARPELSVRQIQGSHYGGVGAGKAARLAP